jgi:hypothetical protein
MKVDGRTGRVAPGPAPGAEHITAARCRAAFGRVRKNPACRLPPQMRGWEQGPAPGRPPRTPAREESGLGSAGGFSTTQPAAPPARAPASAPNYLHEQAWERRWRRRHPRTHPRLSRTQRRDWARTAAPYVDVKHRTARHRHRRFCAARRQLDISRARSRWPSLPREVISAAMRLRPGSRTWRAGDGGSFGPRPPSSRPGRCCRRGRAGGRSGTRA